KHLVHMVIDPSLSTKPLSEDQWVGDMGFQRGDPKHPFMLVVPGSDYAPYEATHDWEHRNLDTPDFSHLPPFQARDVQSACGVMFKYLTLEVGSTPDNVAAKQEKLVTRTGELVTALLDAQKLTDDVAFDAAACRAAH